MKNIEISVEFEGVMYEVLYQNGIVWFVDPTSNLHAKITSDTEKTHDLSKDQVKEKALSMIKSRSE